MCMGAEKGKEVHPLLTIVCNDHGVTGGSVSRGVGGLVAPACNVGQKGHPVPAIDGPKKKEWREG